MFEISILNPTGSKKIGLTHFIKYPKTINSQKLTNFQKTPECLCLRIEKLDNLIATSYTDGKIIIFDKSKNKIEKILLQNQSKAQAQAQAQAQDSNLDPDLDSSSTFNPPISSLR
jgi:hypothetical protein